MLGKVLLYPTKVRQSSKLNSSLKIKSCQNLKYFTKYRCSIHTNSLKDSVPNIFLSMSVRPIQTFDFFLSKGIGLYMKVTMKLDISL